MTTMTITPAEVTMEMLVAGVESNETPEHYPAKYKLVDGSILYSVKYPGFAGWSAVEFVRFEEIAEWMNDDSGEGTIWTTTVEQETAQ